MSTGLSVLLEIIKITVPALIVFVTVYFVFKQYLDKQYQLKALEFRQSQQKSTLPMRLQAYERLSLFCERISISNLVLRLKTEGTPVKLLRVALLTAIQQEYEHNITQQVYVSENLWEIIKIARDEVVTLIHAVAEKMDPDEDAEKYASLLVQLDGQQDFSAIHTALQAIKKEAGLLL